MDNKFMKEALKEAHKAELLDEVPIGCVIVKDGKVIARGHNLRESKQNAICHAEIIAIQKACKKLGTWRLEDCELYVTLEPCTMCTGAIINSRIKKVVYGASEKRFVGMHKIITGFEPTLFNHSVEYVGGLLEEDCSSVVSQYFKNKRLQKKNK